MRKFSIIGLVLLGAALYWWVGGNGQAPAPAVPGGQASTATQPALPATTTREQASNAVTLRTLARKDTAYPSFLPPEAIATLRLIASDGPYPHRQDGTTFGNREGRLPRRQRGYYREFTVATPGLSHRGARRIVTGGRPPETCYYTDDHYESFRQFDCALSAQGSLQ